MGALVLLIWILLRQRPGLGTICNVLVVGTAADAALWALPSIDGYALRSLLLVSAIVLNAAATGAYMGAGLGPGPRDGLTTGVVRVTGCQIRWAKLGIEATLLILGLLMGGVAGVGTVAFAVATGPLLQIFLPMFTIPSRHAPAGLDPKLP